MSTWWRILSRRKTLPRPSPQSDPLTSSQNSADGNPRLARVLTTFDLTALGVGSTLGVGVYVLAGHVAKETAGPSVVVSFLIAAVASVFAGLCYAEFGARVPRAGSAYIYSYVCVGEFIAFIIGWNLILEYVIGSASVAKGLSVYIDTLVNNTLRNTFIEIAPIHSSFMAEYFDFFSFAITLLLGGALAFGVKESSLVNNIFTLINIAVVIFVIIAGSIKADPKNWSIAKSGIPPEVNGGNGGFFPFGIAGTIKGAATCFYGFVGFDCIATTGEEVKNPQRAIPMSIIVSLFIIFLSYFGTSTVVTMMWPYYLQDPDAPIPHAFAEIGWVWAKWIVSIGGIFGLFASLFGAMFPLPRIIYAMANDALVFRFLGAINSRFNTPVVGTLIAAILTGLMSALFNLKQLVNMMSIGTLMAYTIVAACVIILRYSEDGHIYETNATDYTENLNLIPPQQDVTMSTLFKQMFNFSNRNPTYLSQRLVTVLVFIFTVLCLILASLVSYLQSNLESGELQAVIPTVFVVILMLATLISIWAQPTANASLSFKVPLVPLVPALSICINLYLMMMLDGNTWIRFGVWMAIGLPIYYTSCKLDKMAAKPPPEPTKNGHINHAYAQDNDKTKSNGVSLTIPDIAVDPPRNDHLKTEDPTEPETETTMRHNHRERMNSVDSNDFNNAVSELDKVLIETENTYSDNYEAINPETEYTNCAILTKYFEDAIHVDKISLCSSDSESDHSKEHHVEAQIHQEDSDSFKSISLHSNSPIMDDTFVNDSKDTDSLSSIEDSKGTTKEVSILSEFVSERNKDSEVIDNIEIFTIPVPPPLPEDISNKIVFVPQTEKEIPADETDKEVVVNNIPVPPPIAGLLQHSPSTFDRPIFDFSEVKLKSVPTPLPRKRNASTSSEGPTDNVKTGSVQYTNIKSRLNTIFKKPAPYKTMQSKYLAEEKIISPAQEKDLEVIDRVLEQFEEEPEEIPTNYRNSKIFKDKLSNILMKKPSISKNDNAYERRYESKKPVQKIEQKSVKVDEVTHKNLMADTLRSIKSLKGNEENNEIDDSKRESVTEKDEKNNQRLMLARSIKSLKGDDELTNEIDNDKRESVTEKDKKKHQRLMLATLRSIKLRKTGLSLTDDDRTEITDITKENTDR